MTPDEVEKLRDDLNDIVGGPVVIDAEVIDARLWNTKLDDMVTYSHLEDRFVELAEEKGATVVDVLVRTFRDGYAVDAIVAMFEHDMLTDSELSEIQKALEGDVDAPVRLQVAELSTRAKVFR